MSTPFFYASSRGLDTLIWLQVLLDTHHARTETVWKHFSVSHGTVKAVRHSLVYIKSPTSVGLVFFSTFDILSDDPADIIVAVWHGIQYLDDVSIIDKVKLKLASVLVWSYQIGRETDSMFKQFVLLIFDSRHSVPFLAPY